MDWTIFAATVIDLPKKDIMRLRVSKLLLVFFVIPLMLASCENHKAFMGDEISSCEACHTNYATLQKVFSPDAEPPASGCGGEAPYYEPYDRVYMGGEGFKEFKESGHYGIGCTGCHNGDDKASEKGKAHSGTFLAHPSSTPEESCAVCHAEVVKKFATSIHNGMGQKRKVAIRSGFEGSDDFDKLPAHQIEGYNKNCATCHGSCGNCHVSRPKIGGGGLANGHMFKKEPDMVGVCVSCHSSRGGHAYMGVASGTVPDVHLTKKGYKCTTCHSGAELHGDGTKVEQRYAYDKLPKCQDCHTGMANKNTYHTVHITTFDCQICHSQVYNNCGSCHVHVEGARIPSYMDFKIALNPLPDIKTGFKFALVRRTLAAPDSWSAYDVPILSDFDALPTYNYTTPHNILKWTARTQVAAGGTCYSNCHIRKEGTTIINKNLYLFKSNLLDWEKNATTKITVDNSLPANWLN
jgi:thiosulfate/3-mercaptopyruvate sulfurtransferase